jgi:hypothetical protein
MNMDNSQLDAYRQGISDERRRLVDALEHGCGDNSCVLHKPRGMATNGGCQCIKTMPVQTRRDFLHALNTLRAEAIGMGRFSAGVELEAELECARAGEAAALERVAELEAMLLRAGWVKDGLE